MSFVYLITETLVNVNIERTPLAVSVYAERLISRAFGSYFTLLGGNVYGNRNWT